MAALFSSGIAAWNERAELSARFGEDWTWYRSNVRVWIPRWRPHLGTDQATVFIAATCEPCSDIGRFIVRRPLRGLVIAAAESSPTDLTRITYQGADAEVGVAALGRTAEHVNLAWAVGGWIARLPLVNGFLQLVADAVGAGPRRMSAHDAEDDPRDSGHDRPPSPPRRGAVEPR